MTQSLLTLNRLSFLGHTNGPSLCLRIRQILRPGVAQEREAVFVWGKMNSIAYSDKEMIRGVGTATLMEMIASHSGRTIKRSYQFVYVLQSKQRELCKIGFSSKQSCNVGGLRSGLGIHDLEILHRIHTNDARYLEAVFHGLYRSRQENVYKGERVSREFFRLNDIDLGWLYGLDDIDSESLQLSIIRLVAGEESYQQTKEMLTTIKANIEANREWEEREERSALLIRIGDLRELTTEQLRQIAAVVEGN